MISIDAMGTQKAIANKIIMKQADYCLAVKENQKQLLEAICPYFELSKTFDDSYETLEKAHGQIEVKQYEVITDTEWLRQEHPDWGHLQDRKSTRLNSSHANISYAVFCLTKTILRVTTPPSRLI